MKKRNLLLISTVLLLVFALTFAGCGKEDTGSESGQEKVSDEGVSASTDSEKRVIKVGTGNAFNPFCYLDENEQPTGYDYECIVAVADYLSDKYEFVITADDFSNILIGLDTGAYDIAVHHYGYTAERAENYLYAQESTMYFGNFQVGYLKGRTDINSMEDLAGKTVLAEAGSMAETLIQNWNEENPDYVINIDPVAGEDVKVASLQNGLDDGIVLSKYDLETLSARYDDFLDLSDFTITSDDYDCGTYFLYSIGDEELQQDIDNAIVALRENGTLSELSIKWLGDDYTENPNK